MKRTYDHCPAFSKRILNMDSTRASPGISPRCGERVVCEWPPPPNIVHRRPSSYWTCQIEDDHPQHLWVRSCCGSHRPTKSPAKPDLQKLCGLEEWLRGRDLNPRPSG